MPFLFNSSSRAAAVSDNSLQYSVRHFDSDDEIEQFIVQFQDGTWPFARWTHGAHLAMALWHLRQYPPEEATRLIRDGIQHYNRCQGIPTTPTRGYHETLTLFWIWAVRRFLQDAPAEAGLAPLANQLIAGRFGDKNLPFEYYSRDRLMSWTARTAWVAPDLKPLEPPEGQQHDQ
jgi:hypothetical protein